MKHTRLQTILRIPEELNKIVSQKAQQKGISRNAALLVYINLGLAFEDAKFSLGVK